MKYKIVLLGGNDRNTRIVFNYINQFYPITTAVIETERDKKAFLKKRVKRYGYIKTLGQILFALLVIPCLNHFSKNRIDDIIRQNQLNDSSIPQSKKNVVNTINDVEVNSIIKSINPDLIIVNGTRIIKKSVLDNLKCPIINIHVGVTPYYRGVHGMYWALVNNDFERAGVTIHRIDVGIDTGGILSQGKVQPTKTDNFVTYPFLQLATGLKLYKNVINDFITNQIKDSVNNDKGKLWSHPTIWEYLYYFLVKGVK